VERLTEEGKFHYSHDTCCRKRIYNLHGHFFLVLSSLSSCVYTHVCILISFLPVLPHRIVQVCTSIVNFTSEYICYGRSKTRKSRSWIFCWGSGCLFMFVHSFGSC
jgi:hypothetical protein